MKDLIVIGSGGLDVVRLIEDINADKITFNFLGFLEKDPAKIGNEVLGHPILGTDELLKKELSHCAVVNNVMHTTRIHRKVTDSLRNEYHITCFPNLVHPNVDLRHIDIGHGNIIYKDCALGPKVTLGDFNIMYAAFIGHETCIGDYNLFSKVTVGSRAKIGSYNLFGNSSTLTNSVKVGDDNEISVGSVVVRNVKNNHHLMGYPAIEIEEFIIKNFSK